MLVEELFANIKINFQVVVIIYDYGCTLKKNYNSIEELIVKYKRF